MGGGTVEFDLPPPPCSFFYITQKVLVWGCWNFLSFLKYQYITLSLSLKPGFYSSTLPEWLLFPVTNLIFLLTGCMQIICKYFLMQNLWNPFPSHGLFKNLKVIKIWQFKVGENKDLVCFRPVRTWGLRQLKYKSPVLDLMGGLWPGNLGKVRKFLQSQTNA